MRKISIIIVFLITACLFACRDEKGSHPRNEPEATAEMYTCPMPEDSIFSSKPGQCPKCGMDLVKVGAMAHDHEGDEFTCPMHPHVLRNAPGSCPECGMDLIKKEKVGNESADIELESLLKPTNEFVISSIPVITIQKKRGADRN